MPSSSIAPASPNCSRPKPDIDLPIPTISADGELRLSFAKSPRLVGSLSPWRDDTFLVRWDDRTQSADALISFTVDGDGNVSEAHMRRVSPRMAHAYDYQDLLLIPASGESGRRPSKRQERSP